LVCDWLICRATLSVLLDGTRIIATAIINVASLIVVDEKENDGENILEMQGRRGMLTLTPLATTIKECQSYSCYKHWEHYLDNTSKCLKFRLLAKQKAEQVAIVRGAMCCRYCQ
jgi:hypothetical protein